MTQIDVHKFIRKGTPTTDKVKDESFATHPAISTELSRLNYDRHEFMTTLDEVEYSMLMKTHNMQLIAVGQQLSDNDELVAAFIGHLHAEYLYETFVVMFCNDTINVDPEAIKKEFEQWQSTRPN
jgi:hypothetical protein